jgi:hypothetical protein
MFPDGVRVACHQHPAGTDGGVLISADDVAARRSLPVLPGAPAAAPAATALPTEATA